MFGASAGFDLQATEKLWFGPGFQFSKVSTSDGEEIVFYSLSVFGLFSVTFSL